ncbi:alpha/beta hydrolase [Undibacterium sp. CY18W]|uniref:Alpha/beta hydrolase n=1 Tax=Undibacterium hunanense TaxID=2762292 RepID=A0ABR6ZL45_9BURK|nr:alpha/beta hydrolase [Undibacterium hunanense]MBC3916524.1 alpha/beta hydrolase [Undibacterium hunanense]
MKICLSSLFASLIFLSSTCSAQAEIEIPLWQNGAPGLQHEHAETAEDRHETGRLDRYISYVSKPTLTIYPAPADKATGTAVLVVPGGGFRYVCIDKEGIEAAHWLNTQGITAAVLKYRTLAPDGDRNWKSIQPLTADTSRAMRVLRQHASEWKIDSKKIGLLGFSAGGVMALQLLMDQNDGDSSATDTVEQISNRADFIALVYTGLPGNKMPKMSKNTPPVFIVHASDDPKAVPVVAAKIYQQLLEAGAPAELHAFRRGDHGFGMTPASGSVRNWTSLYADWMRDLKLLDK